MSQDILRTLLFLLRTTVKHVTNHKYERNAKVERQSLPCQRSRFSARTAGRTPQRQDEHNLREQRQTIAWGGVDPQRWDVKYQDLADKKLIKAKAASAQALLGI